MVDGSFVVFSGFDNTEFRPLVTWKEGEGFGLGALSVCSSSLVTFFFGFSVVVREISACIMA